MRRLLAAVAILAFASTASAVPSVSHTSVNLGNGLYGVTFTINGNDAEFLSFFAADITITATSPGSTINQLRTSIEGDLSGDGDVDSGDLQDLLFSFGTASGATASQGDVNGDGDVDSGDLQDLLFNFGQSVTPQDVHSDGPDVPENGFRGAETHDGIGTYFAALDSYFLRPFTDPVNTDFEVPQIIAGGAPGQNSYGFRGGTGGDSHLSSADFAYIVTDGDLSLSGAVGRKGQQVAVSDTFDHPGAAPPLSAASAVVPEPSSLGLLVLGMFGAGYGILARRGRKSA
jgi:hypothetical protein